jgi:teichuronic acid exporter
MATVMVGLAAVGGEFGVGMTVVTLRDLSASQLSQLHGLAVGLGVAVFLLTSLLAPAAALFFERAELVPVIVAMATTLVFAGLRSVPAALLQRDLRFGRVAAIESTQALVAAAVSLAAAWFGARHWALVISAVAGALSATTLFVLARPCTMAWPRRDGLGAALTFTKQQFAGSAAWYCYSNADFAVTGRLLGASALGAYTMAWTLARITPERFVHTLTRVTPAFFAALRDDTAELRRWLCDLTEVVTLVAFPLLAGLALVAPHAVPVLLGPSWAGAVRPLQLLALYSMFDVVAQLLSRALTAVGDVRFIARVGMLLAIVLPAGFVVGASWGASGVAATWLFLAPVVRSAMWWRARRQLSLTAVEYARALWPATSATMGMAAAVTVIAAVVPPGANHVIGLALGVAAGTLAYAAALVTFHRGRIAQWRFRLASLHG